MEPGRYPVCKPVILSGFQIGGDTAQLATGCCVVPLGPESVRKVGHFRNRRALQSKSVKAYASWLRVVAREQEQKPSRLLIEPVHRETESRN